MWMLALTLCAQVSVTEATCQRRFVGPFPDHETCKIAAKAAKKVAPVKRSLFFTTSCTKGDFA